MPAGIFFDEPAFVCAELRFDCVTYRTAQLLAVPRDERDLEPLFIIYPQLHCRIYTLLFICGARTGLLSIFAYL